MDHDPQTGVRVLTIEEANALVPQLMSLMRAQLELAEKIQGLIAELVRVAPPGGSDYVDITLYPGDPSHVRDLKLAVAAFARAYKSGWNEFEEMGAVVKDTSAGLLDFYGKIDDRLVWLCWKYPEPSIDYYHELDAGFAGRKPLGEIRRRMLN
jgi:hypothetical protein